jgi:hypothetical protein
MACPLQPPPPKVLAVVPSACSCSKCLQLFRVLAVVPSACSCSKCFQLFQVLEASDRATLNSQEDSDTAAAAPVTREESLMEAIEISSQHVRATILTHGATLARLLVADRAGLFGDVLLGFATDAGWASPTNPCMGCIIGRVAGRTSPRLVVGGSQHALPGCDGGGGGIKQGTNLHGGLRMNRETWKVQHIQPDAVTLQHVCLGKDSGFPGVSAHVPVLRIFVV